MDIVGFLTNGIVGDVVKWGVGVAFGGFIVNEMRKFLKSIGDSIVKKIQTDINSIQDNNLKRIAEDVVRYVSSIMPNAEDNEKLRFAISKAQELTPDIIVSDDKVKVLIESAYVDFKKGLAAVKADYATSKPSETKE